MLKRFRVDNYKTLMNVSYEPGSINLVTGRNNAGKSNLFEALHLLSLLSRYDVSESIQRAGGAQARILNVYQKDKPLLTLESESELVVNEEPVNFSYTLELQLRRRGDRMGDFPTEMFDVARESLVASGGPFSTPQPLLTANNGIGSVYHEVFDTRPDGRKVHRRGRIIDLAVPTAETALNRLYDNPAHGHAIAFRNYLDSWRLYAFNSIRLRGRGFRPFDWDLLGSGSNLVSVLFTMKTTAERLYRQFLDLARLIEPKIDVMNFAQTGDEVYLYVEDKNGVRFSLDQLSSGTLTFFAIAFLILRREKAAAENEPPALIMLEEPENGLYVGLLKPLWERVLNGLPGSAQYVVSSHSPYLIDLFDTFPEDIAIITSDGYASSLRRPDVERVKALRGGCRARPAPSSVNVP